MQQQSPASTPTPDGQAIRKRTQIGKAGRTMLMWTAASAAIVGVAIVVTYLLIQRLAYNERVLLEKQNTIAILQHNNKVIPDLESQMRVLDTNEALATAKASPDDQAIQVVLDALPSTANSFALGASLQKKLLAGIDGLTIESIQVTPVAGVESLSNDVVSTDASGAVVAGGQITFQLVVSGSEAALQRVLTNMERSIRAIDILSLRIESQGGKQLLSIQGQAFYEPERSVELRDKVVR